MVYLLLGNDASGAAAEIRMSPENKQDNFRMVYFLLYLIVRFALSVSSRSVAVTFTFAFVLMPFIDHSNSSVPFNLYLLCLPQIRSAAGSRHVEPQTRCSSAFRQKQMDEQEKSTVRLAARKISRSCRANRIDTGPAEESGRGLLRLGGTPLVAVVKPAHLGNRNDGAPIRRVHRPRFRRVLGQREVSPGFVISGIFT